MLAFTLTQLLWDMNVLRGWCCSFAINYYFHYLFLFFFCISYYMKCTHSSYSVLSLLCSFLFPVHVYDSNVFLLFILPKKIHLLCIMSVPFVLFFVLLQFLWGPLEGSVFFLNRMCLWVPRFHLFRLVFSSVNICDFFPLSFKSN